MSRRFRDLSPWASLWASPGGAPLLSGGWGLAVERRLLGNKEDGCVPNPAFA